MPQAVALKPEPSGAIDPDGFALELEDLCRAVVEPEIDRVERRLQGEFVQRVASAEMEVRAEVQRELRRLHEPVRARHWRADDPRGWEQGDVAAHDGGTWICTAARGAGDEEPGLSASSWVLAADGVSAMQVVSKGGGAEHEVRLTLTSGKELREPIRFDMPRHCGGWTARDYALNSLVGRDGGCFIAAEPATALDDPANHERTTSPWRLVAQRGRTGPAAGPAEIAELRRTLIDQWRDDPLAQRAAFDAAMERAEAWFRSFDAFQRPAIAKQMFGDLLVRTIGAAVTILLGEDPEAPPKIVVDLCARTASAVLERAGMIEQRGSATIGAPVSRDALIGAVVLLDCARELAGLAFDERVRVPAIERMRQETARGMGGVPRGRALVYAGLRALEGGVA